MFKKLGLALLLAFLATAAHAQCTGLFPANTVCGNSTGSPAPPTAIAGGGGVSSVTNSDGSLTISPTTGAVIALLNTAHTNTWSAVQTFNANDLLLAGVIGSTQCLQANGSGIVSGTGSSCGGSPGGSNTDVQFNNLSAFGGDSGFTYAGNGQATLALGTITTNKTALNITGTWNASGVTFDAPLFMNITNTASASGSLLADLQIGGASQLQLSKGGILSAIGFQIWGGGTIGVGQHETIANTGGFGIQISGSGTSGAAQGGPLGFAVDSGGVFNWSNDSTNPGQTKDTGISRDSAGVIDLGNGSQGDSSAAVKVRRVQGNGTPTASSCTGFSAATGSTDLAGKISYTSATTCAITFANNFTNAPFCVITPGSATSTSEVVTTISTLTATFGTAQTAFYYICLGQ